MIDNHEELYDFDHSEFWVVIQEEYPTTSSSSLQIEINDQMRFVDLTSYARCPLQEHVDEGLVEWETKGLRVWESTNREEKSDDA